MRLQTCHDFHFVLTGGTRKLNESRYTRQMVNPSTRVNRHLTPCASSRCFEAIGGLVHPSDPHQSGFGTETHGVRGHIACTPWPLFPHFYVHHRYRRLWRNTGGSTGPVTIQDDISNYQNVRRLKRAGGTTYWLVAGLGYKVEALLSTPNLIISPSSANPCL
jgi:hypothetical protein